MLKKELILVIQILGTFIERVCKSWLGRPEASVLNFENCSLPWLSVQLHPADADLAWILFLCKWRLSDSCCCFLPIDQIAPSRCVHSCILCGFYSWFHIQIHIQMINDHVNKAFKVSQFSPLWVPPQMRQRGSTPKVNRGTPREAGRSNQGCQPTPNLLSLSPCSIPLLMCANACNYIPLPKVHWPA